MHNIEIVRRTSTAWMLTCSCGWEHQAVDLPQAERLERNHRTKTRLKSTV